MATTIRTASTGGSLAVACRYCSTTPQACPDRQTTRARLASAGESEGVSGLVDAPDLAQGMADLAHGGAGTQRVAHRVEHVVTALGCPPQCVQGALHVVGGSFCAQ